MELFCFQGCHIRVTPQLKEKHFPYMMGQHCMAHKTNLTVQALSNLAMVSKLEDLFQFVYAYFLSSPNCHSELTKLAKIMEIGGFKTFNKVKTQWISMLEHLKCILVAYKTLIVKMSQDKISVVQARLNLNLLCDFHTLLTLFYLLSLLKAINTLFNFVQRNDVFICDFVTMVKIC
jgi:hypothetical protein